MRTHRRELVSLLLRRWGRTIASLPRRLLLVAAGSLLHTSLLLIAAWLLVHTTLLLVPTLRRLLLVVSRRLLLVAAWGLLLVATWRGLLLIPAWGLGWLIAPWLTVTTLVHFDCSEWDRLTTE